MTTAQTPTNEPTDETPSAPDRRQEGWCFGPPNPFSEQEAAWWKHHESTVDRWLSAMEEAGDPWWPAADHAAHCLVASRELHCTWAGFSISSFLFGELWEGGTVGLFGSVEKFFELLLEALQRFVSDRVVEASVGEHWLAQMREAREDFVRCYDEGTPQSEAVAIANRHIHASR